MPGGRGCQQASHARRTAAAGWRRAARRSVLVAGDEEGSRARPRRSARCSSRCAARRRRQVPRLHSLEDFELPAAAGRCRRDHAAAADHRLPGATGVRLGGSHRGVAVLTAGGEAVTLPRPVGRARRLRWAQLPRRARGPQSRAAQQLVSDQADPLAALAPTNLLFAAYLGCQPAASLRAALHGRRGAARAGDRRRAAPGSAARRDAGRRAPRAAGRAGELRPSQRTLLGLALATASWPTWRRSWGRPTARRLRQRASRGTTGTTSRRKARLLSWQV